jgi:hypothetical protein
MRNLTIDEAEATHFVRFKRLTVSFFGFTNNFLWRGHFAQMAPGDEIWKFSSSPESWACLAGRAGIALVRDGKIVDSITLVVS